jgi:hypothetical protein
VRTAIDEQTLDAIMLSVAFGQGRSDHVSFLNARVPSIFFTDATGPCYHTAQDEVGIVDFEKLDHEIAIVLRVTRDMANVPTPPPFVSGAPLVSYDDVVGLARSVERSWNDRDRLSSTDRATVANARDDLRRLVAEGRDAFGPDDFSSVLLDAGSLVDVLTHGACDGFLAPQS